jgi:cytosine/adenosine deaminase-related metal-dependent hydrolase
MLRLPETDFHFALLSPHALYSTPPELMRLVAVKMRAENLVASIHIAESEAEWEMYQNARGPLYDWLKTQRPMDDCGGRSPVQRAHELGLLQPNLLAIHCNYLAPGDADLLAKNKVTVVHCPRSHAYFKHAPFPYKELCAAGVNVAIGTDSLASVRGEKNGLPALNLWEEMHLFGARNPNVAPDQIVAMSTMNSERAVNYQLRGLEQNREADLIATSYSGPLSSVAATLVHEPPQVMSRWIAGKRV